jgi:hypothetical protein
VIREVIPFSDRMRARARFAAILFFSGAVMLVVDFTTRFPTTIKGEYAIFWAAAMILGIFLYYRSLELPVREVLQLAQSHDGMLTLTEIATELDVSPDVAIRTLRFLAARNLARPSLQQIEKNLWEFPDCLKLPLAQAMDLAKENDGKLDLQQLMATGVSLESAQQTIDVMKARGFLRQ